MTGGRVLVAKLGLDGHEVGARVVARILRDHGFEVVYLGIRQTPEAVVSVAIAEDVDVIGLSILSGSHLALTRRVLDLIAGTDEWYPPVVVGGVIPPADADALREMGVRAVFTAGVAIPVMVDMIRNLAAES